MATNAVIGALRVTLGADSAQFEQTMKRAQSTMSRVGAVMAKAGAAVAVAAAAAGAAMAAAVMQFSAEADKLAKLSRAIGIPVEDLSRLKHAADLSGVGLDALGNAVKRLSVNMGEVATGAQSTASRAFTALGVSVTDASGKLRSSTEVMTAIAARFAGMEDGAGKTALAIAIFGRAGADLIPLLNEGAGGMGRLMAEADALGITLSGRTAAAAEVFNDNLARLKAIGQGVVNVVASEMLPVFADLTTRLVDVAKSSGVLQGAAHAAAFALKALLTAGALAWAALRSLHEVITTVNFALINMARGEFAIAWEALKGGVTDFKDVFVDMGETLQSIWGETAASLAATSDRLGPLMAAPVMGAAEKAAAAAKKAADAVRQSLESVGQAVGSSLERVFDSIVTGTFDAREAVAALAQDLAKLALRQAATGLAGSLIGDGKGGGLLAGLLGFATGGSFTVGGAGGTDSQLVAFRATPGEMVDVRRPGQGGGGLTYAPVINAGITPMDRAWLAGVLERTKAEAVELATGAVRRQIQNDPGFRRP